MQYMTGFIVKLHWGSVSSVIGSNPYLTDHNGIDIYQSLRSGWIWHKVNFKQSLTGLNSEFSFFETICLTKAEEPSLPYYLPIARGRIIGFIPFPRVLVLSEMQSVLSRIWTHVAVSISYDDNHYLLKTQCYIIIIRRRRNLLTREFCLSSRPLSENERKWKDRWIIGFCQ